MRLSLVTLMFVAVVWLATRFASRPERMVAWTFLVAFGVGVTKVALVGYSKFRSPDLLNFVIEIVVCAVMLGIALKANRIWPLWIAAFQIIICSAHLASVLGVKTLPKIYWATVTLPTYMQVVVACLAIWAHWQRNRRQGWVPDWRLS